MTKKKNNYLTMMEAVMKCLDDNAAAWSSITPIADEVALLRQTIVRIKAVHQKQTESDTAGYTGNKDIAFDNLEALAYKMALKLKAYARKAKNMVLFEAVDFTHTSLNRIPAKELITNCRVIADSASAHVASLAPYDIAAADIDALQTAIDTAEPLIAIRDVVDGSHKAITGLVGNEFTTAREIMIALDEVIEALTPAAYDSFEDTYFATRRINDRRGGKTAGAATAPIAA